MRREPGEVEQEALGGMGLENGQQTDLVIEVELRGLLARPMEQGGGEGGSRDLVLLQSTEGALGPHGDDGGLRRSGGGREEGGSGCHDGDHEASKVVRSDKRGQGGGQTVVVVSEVRGRVISLPVLSFRSTSLLPQCHCPASSPPGVPARPPLPTLRQPRPAPPPLSSLPPPLSLPSRGFRAPFRSFVKV